MQYHRNKFIMMPLMVATCAVSLMGGVKPQKKNKYYIVPLNTASYNFDTIDLMQGSVVENAFDFAPKKKLNLRRIYRGFDNKKHKSLGNFRHNFDKKLNTKVAYKKEHIASKLHRSVKNACENG
ncbi:MAG: hypothetical protein FAF03_03700 [Epsilonproteobacteria bacterium]|nr:hypothetical protein [Campylobacterota bacterium]